MISFLLLFILYFYEEVSSLFEVGLPSRMRMTRAATADADGSRKLEIVVISLRSPNEYASILAFCVILLVNLRS